MRKACALLYTMAFLLLPLCQISHAESTSPVDGLVTVEATKLEGMSDFIVIRTGHSFMRYDHEVARQAVAFLRDGRFSRQQEEGRMPEGH